MTPYQQAIRDFLVGHLNRGTRVACLVGGKDQDLETEMARIIAAENLDIHVEAGLLDQGLRQQMGLAHIRAEMAGRFAPRARLTVLTGHAGLVSPAGKDFMTAHPEVRVGYVFRPSPDPTPDGKQGLSPPGRRRAHDPLAAENFRLTSPRGPR